MLGRSLRKQWENQDRYIKGLVRTRMPCPGCKSPVSQVEALLAGGEVMTGPFACPHCESCLDVIVPALMPGVSWLWGIAQREEVSDEHHGA